MSPHVDILDEPERLRKFFVGSVILHLSLGGFVLGWNIAGHRNAEQWGDPTSGSYGGSVAVGVSKTIPLPSRTGPVNPVANDTESAVPTPPPTTKEAKKVKAPDPNAIAIKSRNAKKQQSSDWATRLDKWRAKQKYEDNQLYNPGGPAANTAQYGMQGGGGVNVGQGTSPFGSRFGYYAEILRTTLGRNWNKSDVDQRLKSPTVMVGFTILKNGTVPASSVRVVQRSGNQALDYSAVRAVYDSSPFPPLPAGFERNEAYIEVQFELRR